MTFAFGLGLFGLLAIPLPIILHLLFRRNSPNVFFPTLRFIKSAMQRTAARRKIQRWLLLACRMLLMAALVFALMQPQMTLSGDWSRSGKSLIAAIVVDTSYSMDLREGGNQNPTLEERANDIINGGDMLLNGHLKNARVSILHSVPFPQDKDNLFVAVPDLSFKLKKPATQPTQESLAKRVSVAVDRLRADPTPDKWLFVISDLQAREFPRNQPLQVPGDIKTILFDLHSEKPASAGITSVSVEPECPIPGVQCTVRIEVVGRPMEAREVRLFVQGFTPEEPPEGVLMASQTVNFGPHGQAVLPLNLTLPSEQFVALRAELAQSDAMEWDDRRIHLVGQPPPQKVQLLELVPQLAANRFLRLAHDPGEGANPKWPLKVTRASAIDDRMATVAVNITRWPDFGLAKQIHEFVSRGGTLVWCLQPGLEESYPNLDDETRKLLADLLPSLPSATPPTAGAHHAIAAGSPPDELLKGLGDDPLRDKMYVSRFVPLGLPKGRDVRAILDLVPRNPTATSATYPLLARKKLGKGLAYTWTALPDLRQNNLPTHAVFLPMVVSMSLRQNAQSEVQNVEIGQPLVLNDPKFKDMGPLRLFTPDKATTQDVLPTFGGPDNQFKEYRPTNLVAVAGLYRWVSSKTPGGPLPNTVAEGKIVAMSNVQYPGRESILQYTRAEAILKPTDVHKIVRFQSDYDAFKRSIEKAMHPEPEPLYKFPMSLLLFLLCVEAMMGSLTKLWKPLKLPWSKSPEEPAQSAPIPSLPSSQA